MNRNSKVKSKKPSDVVEVVIETPKGSRNTRMIPQSEHSSSRRCWRQG